LDKPASIPVPKTLGDAKKSAWWEGYRGAIEEEISNLERLGCWDVVSLKSIPYGTNILRSKFVFDDKRGPDGKFLKFKARMVAMGFTQVEGVDYNETCVCHDYQKFPDFTSDLEFRSQLDNGTLGITPREKVT
jgi:hypothetical protein